MLPTSIENAYLSRDSCTYFNCLVELAEVNFNSCLYDEILYRCYTQSIPAMVAMIAKLANGKWLLYSILRLQNSCFSYAILRSLVVQLIGL